MNEQIKSNAKIREPSPLLKWFSVGTVLTLPFLFGVNLTNILVLKDVVMECAVDQSGLVGIRQCTLMSMEEWRLFNSMHNLGAFFFSLFIVFITLKRVMIEHYLIWIFRGASLLYALSNTVILTMSSPYLLIAARLAIGVSFGITCALSVLYLKAVGSSTLGNRLSFLHGFLIATGIYVGDRMGNTWQGDQWRVGLFIVVAISLLNFVSTIFMVDYLKLRTHRTGARREGGSTAGAMVLCFAFQILQQLSGVNGIILNRDRIFMEDHKLMEGASLPLGAFAFSGIAGSLSSFAISCLFKEKLTVTFTASTFLSALGFLALVVLPSPLHFWGPSIYFMFFSVGLGPVPWLLPSLLFPDDCNSAALAAGIGSSINWISSFVIIYTFDILFSRIGNMIYEFFATICVISALLGWKVLRSLERQEKRPSTVTPNLGQRDGEEEAEAAL